MSVIRWLIPVVVVACLGGFVVGYVAPSMLSGDSLCWGWVRCGVVSSARLANKPVKAARDSQSYPALLSRIGRVRRGDTLEIVVQTKPGAVCAIRFQDAANQKINMPVQFAGVDGRCQTRLPVPRDAALGQANLLICASVCLNDQDRPFFEIQQ